MPTRLAQYLVAKGTMSAESVGDALRKQASVGGTLDTALLEQNQISEAQLLEALGEVSGYRTIHLPDFEPNLAVGPLLPPKIAERLALAPLSMERETLHVACTYPVPEKELKEISFLLGKELELWVALEVRIREWLTALYRFPLGARYESLLAGLRGMQPAAPAEVLVTEALVEGPTLEEQLEREMGIGVGEHTAGKPIPLVVKKSEVPFPWLEPGQTNSKPVDLPQAEFDDRPRWTLQQARFALREATGNANRILGVALRFALNVFDFVAAFAVVRGAAVGWDVRAPDWNAQRIEQISIPLDVSSVFRTVAMTRGSFVGPPPPDAFTRHYLEMLGRDPRVIVLFPVEIRSKLAVILYGDSGPQPISQSRLSDFLLFCQGLPSAFLEAAIPRPASPQTDKEQADDFPVGDAPNGEDASSPNLQNRLAELTGPDAEQRLAATAQLRRFPEPAARELASHFPGPSAWTRGPINEPPEAAELGPIPAALTSLGAAGAAALAPLLDSPDVDVRYFALLTAGRLVHPDLLDGIQRGLFDPHPDVASAARAAAMALKALPRFETVLKSLRQELTDSDVRRRALAARALGALHDREAIDGLIGLTGSEDGLASQAASEALREITRTTYGNSPRDWSQWWAENRERSRAEWLVDGLRHHDLDVRLASIDELAVAFGDRLGYLADGSEPDREAAAMRWALRVKAVTPNKAQKF